MPVGSVARSCTPWTCATATRCCAGGSETGDGIATRYLAIARTPFRCSSHTSRCAEPFGTPVALDRERRGPESNRRIGVLQTPALPLGYRAEEPQVIPASGLSQADDRRANSY